MKGPVIVVEINDTEWTEVKLPATITCVSYIVQARAQKKFFMRPPGISDADIFCTIHEGAGRAVPEAVGVPGSVVFEAKLPAVTDPLADEQTEKLEIQFIRG
jgi:hypothetical protein